ncbi:MAG: HAMP domain-containing protein, partial [Anaerolineae bacterium]|nr:HAMP domain-containing protein [Anaerolineae bacterium]
TSTVVQPDNQQTVSGYTLLKDVFGQPAVMVEIVQPRSVYLQGQATLNYLLISLIVVGVVFAGVMLLLIERVILKPLHALNRGVNTIRETENLATRVPVHGNDELAALSLGFNEMVDALATSRTNLQNAHDELDQRVQERTTQLTATNARLEQEIEDRKQAQQELAIARDQALESLRLKTQILANISHDARTPLNIISLHSELLQAERYGPLTEKQHTKLNDILISARQLLGFLDNLLGEAQMSHKGMQVLISQFNPTTMLEEVVTNMQPLADRRGLTLKLDADHAPEMAYADPIRLRQVVMNLVDNAIKFSENGDIVVSVAQPEGDWWTIEVRDQGVGMSSDVLDRIFDAFYQVDGTITRRVNRGVGLGLSIVRQSIKLMGGEIEVTSVPRQGSTFSIHLPLREGSRVKECV